jgi:hypothetical protein
MDHLQTPLTGLQAAPAPAPRARMRVMAKREQLHAEIDALPEDQLAAARVVVDEDEPDVVGRPKGWGTMDNGQPVPNVVAAVRRSRESH